MSRNEGWTMHLIGTLDYFDQSRLDKRFVQRPPDRPSQLKQLAYRSTPWPTTLIRDTVPRYIRSHIRSKNKAKIKKGDQLHTGSK